MIINNRMVIGPLPYAHLKAIFESLLAESGKEGGPRRLLENWVEALPKKKKTNPRPALKK